jgi:undecaprenyl diphosphate synthase
MKQQLETSNFFQAAELQSLNPSTIPQHIAIIPDGNRRWATSRFLPSIQGHIAGADRSVQLVQAAQELGVKVVTLYCFSTENWKRPKPETEHLMNTIEDYLGRYQAKLVKNGVRLRIIGNKEGLGATLTKLLDKTELLTKECSNFELVLAINYGGRDEITRAIQKMLLSGRAEALLKEGATQKHVEQLFLECLDTTNLIDPDLIIRTSGEMRLSNFLLWQSSYSELYSSPTCWPDFTPHDLLKAIQAYQNRVRRIGGGIA